MSSDNNPAVVIDAGSSMIKAGFAGDDAPSCHFPTVVGTAKHKQVMTGIAKNVYVGDDAQGRRGILSLEYPISHGTVMDWNAMETIWRHTFQQELRTDPTERLCFLTEAPSTSTSQREKTAQILFEAFEVPSLYIAPTAIMSLYASGRTTGTVLESGDGMTYAVSIYENVVQCAKKSVVAGIDVTNRLTDMLTQKIYAMSESDTAKSSLLSTGRVIKERVCYVTVNSEVELARPAKDYEKEYVLPDGTLITVQSERFMAPEVMFKPASVDAPGDIGVTELVNSSIIESPAEYREALYKEIVLGGGNTMFEGLTERLQAELAAVTQQTVKVYASPERRHSAWIGASMVASQAYMWSGVAMTKAEYEEHGQSYINEKVAKPLPHGGRGA